MSEGRTSNPKRWLLLAVLLLCFGAFFYFQLYEYLSFSTLQANRQLLLAWTEQHFLLAIFGFSLVYILAVAASIPGAVFLTITGGFLFGSVLGTVLVVVSATLGAFLIYLAVRLALRDWVAGKAEHWLKVMEAGFKKNAFSYLLVLRLVPLFPFWLVNIMPALLGVSARVYCIATLIGIIPGTTVYVMLGNGLGTLFDQHGIPDLGIIFHPDVLLPLLGLALLAMVPVIYQTIQHRRSDV